MPRVPRLLGFGSKFNNVPLSSARLRNSIVCVYLASPAYSCARRLNARAILMPLEPLGRPIGEGL